MAIRNARLIYATSVFFLVSLGIYYFLSLQHSSPPRSHAQDKQDFFLREADSPLANKKSVLTDSGIIVDNTSAVLELAQAMHRQHGVVLFTMINDAFLDFALSWSCNVASFDSVLQRVLFLTTDLHTA
ncbi:hypothetical protein ACOMHN_018124 [Nucella lapillus]